LPSQTIEESASWGAYLEAEDDDLPNTWLSFGLVSGPPGVAVEAASGRVYWTPSEIQGSSTYEIMVQVTDSGEPALSATNSITVTVNEVNTAPVIAAIPDQTVDELTTLVVNVSATDADLPANQLTYSCSNRRRAQ